MTVSEASSFDLLRLIEGDHVPEEIGIRSEMQILDLLIRMSALRARPAVLASHFNMVNSRARNVYKRVTKENPKKGRRPEVEEWYVETIDRHLQSSWLVSSYAKFTEHATSKMEILEALIFVYEEYLTEFDDHKLNFDRYHYLIRWTFFQDRIKIKPCHRCGTNRLEVQEHNLLNFINCPVCTLSKYY